MNDAKKSTNNANVNQNKISNNSLLNYIKQKKNKLLLLIVYLILQILK